MKGREAPSVVANVVLLILVIAIIIFIAYFYITNYYQPRMSKRAHITQLCPEWANGGCTRVDANELKIKIDDRYWTLAELCADEFPQNPIESCKKLCIGCPR